MKNGRSEGASVLGHDPLLQGRLADAKGHAADVLVIDGYLNHTESRGLDQFTAACERDLECGTNLPGVVSRVRLRTWTDTSQEGERSSLEITLRAASQVRSGAEQQGRPANQHPHVGSQFAAIQLVD
jgi:hypothetical protein